MLEQRIRFHGFADHGVSEALYLADPDGNGVELYCDRPRSQWSKRNGQIMMVTEQLDLDGLLQEVSEDPVPWKGLPTGTDIGHIHLQVSDLGAAEEFYGDNLGFDVTSRIYPGALFLSAGGYHHHLGLNVWAGKGAPRPQPGSLGLISFSVELPTCSSLEQIIERCQTVGVRIERRSSTTIIATDPDGNGIEIRCRDP
jgi:catechol 2,3-dioxygenase